MAIANKFPAIRPSLNLDFANSKTVDPRVTFTRNSAATYYDGVTVAKAEENLLKYSQDFGNAVWYNPAKIIAANSAVAPDGSISADKYIPSTSAQNHAISVLNALTVGTKYTLSVYAKQGEYKYIAVSNAGVGVLTTIFDLSTGAKTMSGASVESDGIVHVGDGWYRCFITVTASYGSFSIYLTNSPTAINTFAGDGTSGIYVWGAQLEQRAQATAYTPTTDQPITRYIPKLLTAPAGVPRIDHDPVTGECKGLLIEEQRTNLLTYSEQFDNAAWPVNNMSVVPNTAVAPDGMLTGDKLVESNLATQHYALQLGVGVSASTPYTLSGFFKAAGRSQVRLVLDASQAFPGAPQAFFDLGSGTVFWANNSVAAISSVGNGWYRCSITATSSASAAWVNVFVATAVNGTDNYQGDGTSGLYIFGAQLEVGSFPTSYIKTEASQATRVADAAVMTGTNFSDWYRQDEGTFSQEITTIAVEESDRYSLIVTNSTPGWPVDGHSLRNYNGIIVAQARKNSAITCDIVFANPVSVGAASKIAYAYKNAGYGGAKNAEQGSVYASGDVPTGMSTLYFSNGSSGYYIKRLAYYPKRLSNEQLQALSA